MFDVNLLEWINANWEYAIIVLGVGFVLGYIVGRSARGAGPRIGD